MGDQMSALMAWSTTEFLEVPNLSRNPEHSLPLHLSWPAGLK